MRISYFPPLPSFPKFKTLLHESGTIFPPILLFGSKFHRASDSPSSNFFERSSFSELKFPALNLCHHVLCGAGTISVASTADFLSWDHARHIARNCRTGLETLRERLFLETRERCFEKRTGSNSNSIGKKSGRNLFARLIAGHVRLNAWKLITWFLDD